MAVVLFWKRSATNTNAMASTKFNRGHCRGVCQFVHCRMEGLTNHQAQFIAKSRLLVPRNILRLKYHQIQPSKITMRTIKTNNLEVHDLASLLSWNAGWARGPMDWGCPALSNLTVMARRLLILWHIPAIVGRIVDGRTAVVPRAITPTRTPPSRRQLPKMGRAAAS
jgi:hypothetical protein